jgi:hypothetical protein
MAGTNIASFNLMKAVKTSSAAPFTGLAFGWPGKRQVERLANHEK